MFSALADRKAQDVAAAQAPAGLERSSGGNGITRASDIGTSGGPAGAHEPEAGRRQGVVVRTLRVDGGAREERLERGGGRVTRGVSELRAELGRVHDAAVGEQADQLLADIPAALTIGENLNIQPVKVPLFVSAPLGFLAIYLLAQFDEFARRVLLAQHIALIDRTATGYWINEGARLLRSAFAMAQRYRFSGTTRDDYAANNAAARAAREKYGELPQDVLEGTRRSRFAPPIRSRPSPSTG